MSVIAARPGDYVRVWSMDCKAWACDGLSRGPQRANLDFNAWYLDGPFAVYLITPVLRCNEAFCVCRPGSAQQTGSHDSHVELIKRICPLEIGTAFEPEPRAEGCYMKAQSPFGKEASDDGAEMRYLST